MLLNQKKYCLVLPVRLNSNRFPKKVLAKYKGKTLLENSILIAKEIQQAIDVDIIVATPDNEIADIVKGYNVELFLMDNEVSCGSERVKHVYNKYPNYDYYISLPVDEPSINPQEIIKVIKQVDNNAVYTLWTRFYCISDIISAYSCKLVTKGDDIIYTSRAIVPSSKDSIINPQIYKKHVGVFIFPKKMLEFDLWKKNECAEIEGLEQNMFINREFKFKAIQIQHIGFGVDSYEQIRLLEERLS